MKKIVICIIAINFLLPISIWGEDVPGDRVKYIPRTVAGSDILSVGDAYGEITRYKYNPITETWKTCTNNSTIKYNPMENEWIYVYPRDVLRFNPAENNWDYQGIEKRLRYDIMSEKWFYSHPQRGPLTLTSPLP